MGNKIYTEIEINRSPSQVRSVFLDFPSIPQWHTGFTMERTLTEKAKIENGEKLNVNAGGSKFTPIVLIDQDLQENTPEVFKWMGSIPYVFSGEHNFRFEPSKKTPGSTTFVQYEEFTGMLSFIMGPTWSMGISTQKMFSEFNESLKKKVEST